MLLSATLATYNEEKNILLCLKSVYDWVDEIVVVDGTSTDNTVEVIKSFDTRHKINLFKEINPTMFHKNKQKALDRCKGEWILQLDADEKVSQKLKEEILKTVTKKEQGSPTAYWIPRLNFFLGKALRKGGQYPDPTIRLYKNGVAYFPCKSIHEQVEVKGKVGHLTSDLLHYPYPTFKEYLNKWHRYCKLEAIKLREKGVSPLSPVTFVKYILIQPPFWFAKTYIRHRGFMDGWAGFVFSFFSSLRFPAIYIRLFQKYGN